MENNNWRPIQGAEPLMEITDWRNQLQPDSRQRIVNKIMDTLKKRLPFSGQDGLHELKKIAERFEEKIYSAAISQMDYLRKISLEIVIMETKSLTTIPKSNPLPPNQVGPSVRPQDPGAEPSMETTDWRTQLLPDSRQRIVNKIMDTFKRHLPLLGQEGLHELKKIAERFEEKSYSAAASQSDYLRTISVKLLTMENKSQTTIPNPLPPNQVGPSVRP